MSDPNTEQEPTMEEILSSIRRIISEDDEGTEEDGSSERVVNEEEEDELAAAVAIPDRERDEDDEPIEFDTAEETENGESFDENVFDLTEMVTEDGSVVSLKEGGADPQGEAEPEAVEAAAEADPDAVPPEEAAAELEAELGPVADDSEPEPEPEPVSEAEPDSFEELTAEDAGGKGADGEDLISGITASAAAGAFSSLAHTVTSVHGQPLGGSGRTLEELVKELLKPMLRGWLDKNLPPIVERLVEKEISKLAHRADDQ